MAQNKPLAALTTAQNEIHNKQRDFMSNQYKKLNPNVDVPIPRLVSINKAAIDLVEFDDARDDWRQRG